jgi:3-dehydroquinate synthase
VSDAEPAVTIASHRGPYEARFTSNAAALLADDLASGAYFLLDQKVVELYPQICTQLVASGRSIVVTATERNKNLDRIPELAQTLLEKGIRRDAALVAVGGGITQDIACFLASVLMRGIGWKFYPTTLLAQADSCIGSKSSINVGKVKNSAGTF